MGVKVCLVCCGDMSNSLFLVYLGQRYYLNSALFGGEGFPLFVYIGGEGELTCDCLESYLYMYTLATQQKAYLLGVEHRFYGKSWPTANMTTDALSVLSSEQALADLARIIEHVKETNSELINSPVITFGGSYPGNLAAWFRLKYPSSTVGSVASSAPLYAETNFSQYMDVVGASLNYITNNTGMFSFYVHISKCVFHL